MQDALLLNADFTPLGVVSWQRAICLVMDGKVRRVVDYVGASVRSPSLSVPLPAVVSLPQYQSKATGLVTLSRRSVLARDRFTCQYCGFVGTRSPESLTIDHVVPRSRARDGWVRRADGRRVGVHAWENLIAACRSCNHRKGSRTPSEAGMPLRSQPRRPGAIDAVRILFARVEVVPEWAPFLPDGAGLQPREG